MANATTSATESTLSPRSQRDSSARKVAMLMKTLCNITQCSHICRELCKMEKCTELCIKKELGEDDNKKPAWTALFSRAPAINSDLCIEACYFGCLHRVKDADDD